MSLASGSRLGPYEIVSPIGAGGMGEVYRAKDPRLGRDVAIKVLPASFSSDADRLRRFEQEAKAAGILNHPNITAVYDIGSHDGAPYVVQELLEGETLRTVLAGGRLSTRRAVDYSLQIMHGLAAAHEKGIVHRDLKPENIFVTNDGRVKLLDFGLAKLTHTEEGSGATNLPTATAGTEPGVVLGTLGYMSPEQVRGRPSDARSDIFAFGAILYEMLSGKRAFHGDSAADTMSAILKEDPPDLSVTNQSVPPGLERIVRHCLEKNPEQRFHSAHDVAFDLETLSSVSAPSSAVKPSGRSRFRVTAVLPLLALAIGLGIGWLLTRSGNRGTYLNYVSVSFRRAAFQNAFFAPDGNTVVYSESFGGGPYRILSTQVGSTESRALGLPDGDILSISRNGELAISIGRRQFIGGGGTLARVPLTGGAPRPVLESVILASWTPDGRDLAIVRRIGGKSRIEFPMSNVLYETGGLIYAIRFSPKGDGIAFISEEASGVTGELQFVDLKGKVRPLAKGLTYARGIAWRPDGKEVWVSHGIADSDHEILAIALDGRRRIVEHEAARIQLQDISKDGRILGFDMSFSGEMAARGPAARDESNLTWLDYSWLDAMSSDGKTVLFDEIGGGGGKNGAFYLRSIGEPAAVRLGEGTGLALSRDGQWALATASGDGHQLVLVPTGPGQPRPLARSDIDAGWGEFLPDGEAILVKGSLPNHAERLYLRPLASGEPKPVSPEGLSQGPIALSPDGKLAATPGPDGKILLCPLDGGSPRAAPGSLPGEVPVAFRSDGKVLFAYQRSAVPAAVYGLDLETGKRELWKELAPADRNGVYRVDRVAIANDGQAYAYSYGRRIGRVVVVDGLK
ncbi:MAG TPA: protein kinase [Thermoanaerobaculia bacterium]